jgi:hypothetical protein
VKIGGRERMVSKARDHYLSQRSSEQRRAASENKLILSPDLQICHWKSRFSDNIPPQFDTATVQVQIAKHRTSVRALPR